MQAQFMATRLLTMSREISPPTSNLSPMPGKERNREDSHTEGTAEGTDVCQGAPRWAEKNSHTQT